MESASWEIRGDQLKRLLTMTILLFLALFLAPVAAIVLPTVFVTRAARRRSRAIVDRQLVLADSTNTLAIVGFVLAFFAAVPGVVCSHVSLAQLKRKPEQGWGLAVAGLWIGYSVIACGALFILNGVRAAVSG
ncbi:hypothetical protein AWU67_15245 [Microterricola viridarii]|uniref:DUF4190 domain-containing protein n=1 Tax=Microterricola viridarii TaxID=412690 RepID=A0A109QXH4_9MICO|nr:hypothetical protein AWU67_15245 [Microterricola viridarii]